MGGASTFDLKFVGSNPDKASINFTISKIKSQGKLLNKPVKILISAIGLQPTNVVNQYGGRIPPKRLLSYT